MENLVFSGMLYGEQITIQQVQKRTARKLFNAGEKIYLQTSNMAPFNIWADCMEVQKDEDVQNFDTLVNSYEYYNCSNQTGRYTHFYKKLK